MQTSVATLEKLGFEVVSSGWRPLRPLDEGETYTWSELGDRFDFAANYLSIAGGMVPRPERDAVLLITHPQGGRSFDYGDYWDGSDLIYTGRGLDGDQKLEGANLDVAENRRQLLLFEHSGARELIYLSEVTCTEYWETMAPDRSGPAVARVSEPAEITTVISDFGGVLTTPLVQSFAAVQDETGIAFEELATAMARIQEEDGRHPLYELETGT